MMQRVKEHSLVIRKLTAAALCTTAGLFLPFLSGQIPQIGEMMLPMHLPVFLCGLICGWRWGLGVGFLLPLLRSLLFTMPPLYPMAAAMAFELATYGSVAGALYARSKWQCIRALYGCLIPAMIAGRIVWGAAMAVMLGGSPGGFTWQTFLTGGFLTAIPGIILQLVLIPAVMAALNKTGIVRYKRTAKPARHGMAEA